MPRTKGSKNNNSREQKRKEKEAQRKLNITVMVLIVISIILAVLIYTKSGYLGKTLSPALGGVFGYIKYLIPVGLLCMSFYIAHERDTKYYSKKLVMFLIVLVLIDVILSCYQNSKGNIDINGSLESALSRAFELGKTDIGGGVIGTLIAYPLIKFIGTPATIIASIGIALTLIVFIFSLHPADFISKYMDKFMEPKDNNEGGNETEAEVKETWRERRNREKLEKREALKNREPLEEQITINLKEPKKYDHSNDGLDVPNFKSGKLSKSVTKTGIENISANSQGSNKDEQDNNSSLFSQQEVEKEAKTKEVLQLEHTLTVQDENYEFPPVELLATGNGNDEAGNRKALLATAEKLRRTLYSFGVSAKVENVSVGPAITRYELAPAEGVRVSKIANLADDIALSLEAETIRIEAPIPGKHTVGIEVPNKAKEIVVLRDIIESDKFENAKSKVTFGLGKDIAGDVVITDIAKMPHLLIAGSTGSGKSVCINTLITSIIYKAKPSEVKLLMVDPKVVELSVYNGIPHLLIPVVTDPKKAAGALQWAVQEMLNRYNLFATKNIRDIKGYNEIAEKAGEPKLPQIVVVIDELADLMMAAAKEVEDAICRVAQMGRAAGMHLVIATQRPSVDVITGLIKANVPSRIAFAVSSQVDSRTILDGAGAEKLLGKGDMLFNPIGATKPTRIQGAFVSDKEVENIVKFIKRDGEIQYDERIMESIERADEPEKVTNDDEEDDTDELLEDAIEMCIDAGQASASLLQRRLKVGYARAGRIIDQMEQRGIISGYQGSKPREVLMSKERWQELKLAPEQVQNSIEEQEENEGEN